MKGRIAYKIIFFSLIITIIFSLSACKKTEQFNISYSASVGGSVSGELNQTIEKGGNGTAVTAVPDDGYVFVNWSDGLLTAARQEANVEQNLNLCANFEKAFTISYNADTGGDIEGKKLQSIINGGDAEEVVAVPNMGYRFSKWSDNNISAARQDKNITSALNYVAYFERVSFEVTYSADSGGHIEGKVSQNVGYGNDAEEVEAVADTGYAFIEWSDGLTTATRRDLNVTSKSNFVAYFAKIVEISYNADFGGSISGRLNQSIIYGRDAETVTAIAENGYKFVKWSDELLTATRQDKNITDSANYIAYFERISVEINYRAGSGGKIEGEKDQVVFYGDDAEEVTAVANPGYHFVRWSDGNTNATRQDKNVTTRWAYVAIFELDGIAANYNAGLGGIIDGNTLQNIIYGENTTLVKAIPDIGYKFLEWSDTHSANPERIDTNVTAVINATAVFIKLTFSVKFTVDGNGTIEGVANQTIAYGESTTTITAKPNTGYKFVKWSDTNSTNPERIDSNITAAISATAIFEKITYSVKYSTDGNGTIEGVENQTVKYGESTTTIKAKSNTGYKFVKWSDTNSTNAERTDTGVTAEISATAIFEKLTYSVEYSADTGGSIEGTANQTIAYDESGTKITAKPNTGYKFVKWSDTNSTNPERTDTNVTAAISATAIFEKLTYSVKYVTDGNGTVEGTANQTIAYGESGTKITAVANTGYKFVKWSDTNSTNPERTDINVTAAISATAVFEKLTYSVKYVAGTGGYIIGETTQTVAYGENSLEVFVMIYPGYMFTEWSDNYGFHQRVDYAVTEDITVTASFAFLFAGGNGTKENPLLINTYDQLLMMNYFPDSHYKLNKDLNLQGINHLPMFHWGYMFNGSFDGGNHTVSNLLIDKYLALPSLFGSIGPSGEVKNLKLTKITIKVPNYNTEPIINNESVLVPLCIGVIAGVSYGKLENITISQAKIMAAAIDYSYIMIGGLVGMLSNTITNCHADIDIELNNALLNGNGDLYVGGLVGRVTGNAGEVSIDITLCSAQGSIDIYYAGNKGNRLIGGLIGFMEYDYIINSLSDLSKSVVNISDCFSSVNIYCNYESECGGLLGYTVIIGRINLMRCFSTGNITIAECGGSGGAGGLLGFLMSTSGLISGCYATGNIEAQVAAGFVREIINSPVIGFVYESLRFENCYASGNTISSAEAAGFCHTAILIGFYQCYSTGSVSGWSAAGFAFIILIDDSNDGMIEECFSTGVVIVNREASGFIYNIAGGSIKNCYSKSDIYFSDIYNVRACGFVYSCNSTLVNCYYTGKIVGSTQSITYGTIGALVGFIGGQIINCHWLKSNESIAKEAIAYEQDRVKPLDIIFYNDIIEMYFLADMLNTGSEPAWDNVSGDAPQLIYYIN